MSTERNATVEIMRNSDGSIRTMRDEGDAFIWERGNFSCDCNRRGFFLGAGGDQDPDFGDCKEGDPGTGDFSVRLTVAGSVVYADGQFLTETKPAASLVDAATAVGMKVVDQGVRPNGDWFLKMEDL